MARHFDKLLISIEVSRDRCKSLGIGVRIGIQAIEIFVFTEALEEGLVVHPPDRLVNDISALVANTFLLVLETYELQTFVNLAMAHVRFNEIIEMTQY